MLKLNPTKIRTFVALLALMLIVVYLLSDKMIDKGLFTKETIDVLLFFLFIVFVLGIGAWGLNNISEKEIDADTRVKTNKNTVIQSKNAQITNKNKGNENNIQDSEGASIQND